MKKLLIIALLFWGCDYAPTEHTHDDENSPNNEWECVFHLHTDHPCINPSFPFEESTGGNPPDPPDSVIKISEFYSFEECKVVCPDTMYATSNTEITTCYLLECLEKSD